MAADTSPRPGGTVRADQSKPSSHQWQYQQDGDLGNGGVALGASRNLEFDVDCR